MAPNPAPFVWERRARGWRLAGTLAAVWAALIAAALWLDAALWVLAVPAVFTLPGLFDLWRNPVNGARVDDTALSWRAGRLHARLLLSEIDVMRFDTRLDFSVRVSALLHTGRRVRMPFEATPPHRSFEAALIARGVRTARHHFELFQ